MPLNQRSHVGESGIPLPKETPLHWKCENVAEDLRDLPSRAKLSDEVRSIAHHLERVRSARPNRNLVASLNNPRFARSLTNAEGAFAHKKPLLLAEMPVERPSIAKATCMDLRLQEISVCLEDYCAQIVHGTLENVTGRNRL
jgi:hypothetical protein